MSIIPGHLILKILLMMKLAIMVILISAFQAFAHDGFSQKRVNLSMKNTAIIGVLQEVEKKYDYRFFYENELKGYQGKIDFYAKNATIDYVMQRLLANTSFSYKKINSGLIVIIGGAPSNPFFPVTGTVTDAENNPLSGVSISEKGTTNGTTTDESGRFKIEVQNSNSVLVITRVGFITKEIEVVNQAEINVILVSNVVTDEEVVVVGYGTQKKINTTGAFSSISTRELVQSPVANISNSLAGRMPGLFARQRSGEPGNDQSTIKIRGIGTFSGSTDPLVLVDGIEVSNYNNIDPNEIESLTILKDASSTAVYGIRGANGVIIITTKRGKAGTPQISYTFNQAFNTFTDLRNAMTSAQYAANHNSALWAESFTSQTTYFPKYTPSDIELYANGTDPVFHPNMNWPKLMFRKYSPQSQHNITLNGGQNAVRYFISAGFFNQQGQFKDLSDLIDLGYSQQASFKRVNLRSNFNFDVTEKIQLKLDLSTQTEFRSGANGRSADWIVGDVMRASPLGSPGIVDGKIVNLGPMISSSNPYMSYILPGNSGGIRREYRNYLNGLLRGDFNLDFITKGLSTHVNVAIQNYNNQELVRAKGVILYTATRTPDGIVYIPDRDEAPFSLNTPTSTYNRRLTGEFGFDYKRYFGSHYITALLLYNQQKTFSPSLEYYIPKGYQSYVGRITYDYKTKYLAEANVGYNGTENFAPGNRFGLFPAFSLGWVASNEAFFPKNGIITFLKFRGSYGEVGNDNIGGARFIYRETSFSPISNIYYWGNAESNYKVYGGVREMQTGNPNVTWERAVKKNFGTEMRLFKDKLQLTGEIFHEMRDNILLVPRTFSLISGLIQPPTNMGKMENKGYEVELQYTTNFNQVNFRVSANTSFARNKVLFMDEIPNKYSYQNQTGQRFGQGFYLKTDGIFNTWDEVNDASRPYYQWVNNRIQPGDFKYKDINGDGIVNNFDKIPIGNPSFPERMYGLTLNADYKGFDISVLFQGVSSVSYFYTRFQSFMEFGNTTPTGSPAYLNESWTPERYESGLPINFPRFILMQGNNPNTVGSEFFLTDASYLRLKNMEIGYSFSNQILQRFKIKHCRLYANGNNLLTWSKLYQGIDPEMSWSDVNEEPYPLTRTLNIGINLNF